MPISTVRSNGFTLVELLVVIAVLAIAASAVVLTMRSGEDMAKREASQLAGKLAGLRDKAIIENRPMGAWIDPTAYGFQEYRDNEWVALDEPPLVDDALDEGIVIAGGGRSLVRFDSVGMPAAPATYRFSGDGEAVVTVSAHGEIAVR